MPRKRVKTRPGVLIPDLVDAAVARGFSRKKAIRAVPAIFKVLREAIIRGEPVEIAGFFIERRLYQPGMPKKKWLFPKLKTAKQKAMLVKLPKYYVYSQPGLAIRNAVERSASVETSAIDRGSGVSGRGPGA
jgi:hypothetical protein